MLLTSWLFGWSGRARSLGNDLPRTRYRLRPHEMRRWMAPNVETLEVRLVPTVISGFDPASGTLHINASDADNITVTVDGSNTVLVNGVPVNNSGQNLLATDSNLTNLDVQATGNFSNVLNLSQVRTMTFTSLTIVQVNSGGGADTITGSEFADRLDGGGGLNFLRGGDGNDVLINGFDSDGQAGDDLIVINTPLNTLSPTDISLRAEMIRLGADLRTADGKVSLFGNVVLTNDVIIATGSGSGGNVLIEGAVDSSSAYTLQTTSLSYAAAKAQAPLDVPGGYLVTIRSQAEQDAVQAIVGTNDVWIAASDADVEGRWEWDADPDDGVQFWNGDSNGTAVNFEYSNWASGEPNNSGNVENAAQLIGSDLADPGRWNDKDADLSFPYVVESQFSLSLNAGTATVNLNGPVGNLSPLRSLSVTANQTGVFGGSVSTFKSQTYNSDVAMIGPTLLRAEEVEFNGGDDSVTGTMNLTLAPIKRDAPITVGAPTDAGPASFDITDTDIAALAIGFAAIQIGEPPFNSTSGIGSPQSIGLVTVTSATFRSPVRIAGGSITVTGLDAGTNKVDLIASIGTITDDGVAPADIRAGELSLDSAAGVGGTSNALETAASAIAACAANSGGVFIANTGNLSIGAPLSPDGIFTNGEDAAVSSTGSIAVVQQIRTNGGNVNLTAANGILINGVPVDTTAADSSGGRFTADADSDNNGTGTFAIASITEFVDWTSATTGTLGGGSVVISTSTLATATAQSAADTRFSASDPVVYFPPQALGEFVETHFSLPGEFVRFEFSNSLFGLFLHFDGMQVQDPLFDPVTGNPINLYSFDRFTSKVSGDPTWVIDTGSETNSIQQLGGDHLADQDGTVRFDEKVSFLTMSRAAPGVSPGADSTVNLQLGLFRAGGILSNGDAVTIRAADFDHNGFLNAGSGLVRLIPSATNRSIDLGVSGGSGQFVLTDAELDQISTTSGILVGNTDSGTITINDAVTRGEATNLSLTTANDRDIRFVGTNARLDARGGNVSLTTGGTGAIVSGGATTDIGADDLTITVGLGGIGTGGNPLATAVSKLEAVSGSGGVFVSNTGGLTIGGIGAITGVSATGGDIVLSASSPLTVNEPVVNSGGGNVTLSALGTTGPGTAELTFVEFQQDGVGGVDGLNSTNATTVSPDGKHVYSASFGDSAVAVFSRNAKTGALTFVEFQQDGVEGVDGLDSALDVVVSPDGKHVYTASFGDSAVTVFRRNATTGALTFVEFQQDDVNGVEGLASLFGVTVSPDGKHVYTAANSDDAVAVFSRNETTGALTFVEAKTNGVGGVVGLEKPREVRVSPDGKHVYAASFVSDAVAVFSRNETTGALTFVQFQQDGLGDVDGLNGAEDVTISADGNHVYVAGSADSAVAVFSRNTTTGGLTFVELQRDGVAGVDGLLGPQEVTVSPDGNHVYIASLNDNSVAVFSRNVLTGALTFVEFEQDGAGGVDGLLGANSVTVSPDGSHVYVASRGDNAVAVFSRGGDAALSGPNDLTLNANVTASGENGAITLNAAEDILQTAGTVSAAGAGAVNLNAGTDTADGVITMSAGTQLASESGGITLDADGVATLTEITSNSGTITLTGGTFRLSDSDRIDDDCPLVVAFGATLQLNGFNETLFALQGSGTVVNGSATAATLSVNLAGNDTFSGVLGGAGTNENNFGLTKTGNGTFTLSGPNSYTGTTVVNAGTLLINGSVTSNVTVANGTTVGGTGTINSGNTLIVQSGGTVAPGTSPGILNSGNVTLQSGSTLSVELNGTTPGPDPNGHDQLNVTGTVTIGASAVLNATLGFAPAAGDTFVIINNDGSDAISGTFNGLPQGTLLPGGVKLHIFYNHDGGGDGKTNDVALIANRIPVINAQSFSINEDNSNGAVVGTVAATDADSDVTFAITGGNPGNVFAINSTSGQITVSNANGLDFEGQPTFSLTIEVTDDAAATATATMTINLTNTAPSLPVDGDAAADSVSEGAINGDSVGVDADSSDIHGGAINFSLTDNAGGRFAINGLTGVVTVANASRLNFESASSHSITVQAGDGTNHSTQNFTIAVTNVPPSLPVDGDAAADSVSEGAINGDSVGVDADSSDIHGGAITFSLTDNAGGRFAINGLTGVVTVANASRLNFESASSHTIIVQASDGRDVASNSFKISVNDAAPSAPRDLDDHANTVPEGILDGSRVGITLISEDAKVEDIFYRLTNDAGGRFAIDSLTGVVTVKEGRLLQFADAQYTIQAVSVDALSHFSTEESFRVTVTQVPADALPLASILPTRVSVDERDAGPNFITFLVKLNKPSADTITIDFSTRLGDDRKFQRPEGISDDTPFATDEPGPLDFFRSSGQLKFDPGVTEQPLRVQIRPDDDSEPNELFFVQLQSPVNVKLSPQQSVAIAQILDDDSVPQLIVANSQVLEGDSAGQNEMVFTVRLIGDLPLGTASVTADYSIGNIAIDTAIAGDDYGIAFESELDGEMPSFTNQLTFTNALRTREVHIPIMGDTDNEADKTVSLRLQNHDDPGTLGLSRQQAVGTIINDDTTTNVLVAISPAVFKIRENHSGSQQAEFLVTLIGKPSDAVSVNYATADATATAGSDYEAASGTLEFTLADILAGVVQKSFPVTVFGDTDIEPDEIFTVALSLPRSTPAEVSIDPDLAAGKVVIRNDDQAILTEDGDALALALSNELTALIVVADDDRLLTAIRAKAVQIIQSQGLTKAIVIIIDPVDFVLTDPAGRQSGYTESASSVNQIPGTYYSGDGAVELLIVPVPPDGTYNLQLAGLGGDFNASITVVDSNGTTTYIVSQNLSDGATSSVSFQVGNNSTTIPVGLGLTAANAAASAVGVVGAFGNLEFRLALASAIETTTSDGFEFDDRDSLVTGLMSWVTVSARVARQHLLDPLWQSFGSPLGELLGDRTLVPSAIPAEFVDQFWGLVGQTLTGVPSGIYRLGDMLESLLPTLAPRRNRSATPRAGDQGQPNSPPVNNGVKSKRSSLERPRATPATPPSGEQAPRQGKPNATKDKSAQTPNAKEADHQHSSSHAARWLWFTFPDNKTAAIPANRRSA